MPSTSNGDESSFPVMFRQFMTSFTGLADALKGAVVAPLARPTVSALEPAARPRSPSSSSVPASSGVPSSGAYLRSNDSVRCTSLLVSRALHPCPYCGKRYTTQYLKQHRLSHEGRFRCMSASCGKSFSFHSDRTKHYKDRHPGEEAPPDDVFERHNTGA